MKRTRLRLIGVRRKRRATALRTFRVEVYKRAGYRCESCGTDRNLHPHHIFPTGNGGSDDPENGACLCWEEHRTFHLELPPKRWLWIARNEAEAAEIRARLDYALEARVDYP